MADFKAILESDMFTFLCGTQQTAIKIHIGAVKGLSEPLYAMMTNGMQESVDMVAKLEDVEPETFILFSEYAYSTLSRYLAQGEGGTVDQAAKFATERYIFSWGLCTFCANAASYTVDRAGQAIIGRCGSNCSGRSIGSRTCMSCGRKFLEGINASLCASCYGDVQSAPAVVKKFTNAPQMAATDTITLGDIALGMVDYLGASEPEIKLHDCLDKLRQQDSCSNGVSQHAKLYAFANQYMIEPLKRIWLHRMRVALAKLEPDESSISDIVTMMAYTYENTSAGRSGDGTGEDLKELVIKYAVWKAEVLVKRDLFQAMLKSGGDFVADFTCSLAVRPES